MIKPTIGRVVWYNPHHEFESIHSDQPMAALVTYVWSDNMVNLAVFDAHGTNISRTSVFLWQGDGDRPTGQSFAEWMPFQKGQAAKTEALEKELKNG